MFLRLPSTFLQIAATLLVAACAITRVDPPPPVTPPASYKEAGLWQHAAATDAPAVPDEWWTMFGDPVLDDLERRLVIGNENLKVALAQVASARATYVASRAALWPTLSTAVVATRSGSSQSTPPGAQNTQNPSNSFSAGVFASWEVDLWGQLSQASSEAQASYQASADDLAAAKLSAQATLAQTYFLMRTAEIQQALLERTAQGYQRSFDLAQVRYEGGIVARTDVLLAKTQLTSAQAQAIESATQRSQLEHAIAVLLGTPPSTFEIARSGKLPTVPVVPQMLPATLLERRPDIAAAQRRVAAAYWQIGVADAAFFPSFTLSASATYRNSVIGNLFSAPDLFWSLGPSLALAILDGGQRQLASAQARAGADQATATYRQSVLTALQEVEDNLVLADQLQHQAQLQAEALEAAQRNLEITLEQYRAGTVGYLNIVVAQVLALNNESSLIVLQSRQLEAVNQLLKNIAGRWESVPG
jgi:NodT family efflux transporter outer membrane factor (OMF) lipoprotein